MARFVPVSPEVVGLNLGKAIDLYIFLVQHETSPGLVWYGKPVGYAWIQAHWPGEWAAHPHIRMLQRGMAKLRAVGLAETEREWHGGIVIRLPRSVKFGKAARPAEQLSLLSPVAKMPKRAVEKLWKTSESPDFKSDKFVALVATESVGIKK